MSATIWKFTLRGGEDNQYWADMPVEARVLSCGYQGRDFVVWAIVNPTHPQKPHRFHIAGTGHQLPGGVRAENLVGRIEIGTQPLIFHVFDLDAHT